MVKPGIYFHSWQWLPKHHLTAKLSEYLLTSSQVQRVVYMRISLAACSVYLIIWARYTRLANESPIVWVGKFFFNQPKLLSARHQREAKYID